MTGYRVKRNSAIEIPASAIASLTNHFAKFEIDSERIFCGTNGVENSASNLTTAINRIAAALRVADAAHAKADLAQSEKSPADKRSGANSEPPPPIEPAAVFTEIPDDLPADQIPTFLRENSPDESPAIADAIDIQEPPLETETKIKASPPSEPNPDPNPQPEMVEVKPAPQISEPALTLAARDLFASGHNHFETTQRFSSEYDEQEIGGRGTLRRVETYSNDRFFGRGPGILAEIEIEIDCPQMALAHADEPGGYSGARPAPEHINATIEIVVDENEATTASSIARDMRRRIGDPVEVYGTLFRCDTFDARLFLKHGIVD